MIGYRMEKEPWKSLRASIGTIDTIEYREYQQAISDLATGRNTLVILPTAMGKTIIALQVALNRLEKYPWGKVIFLAPTRPLVNQHLDTFSKFLKVGTGNNAPFQLCELNGRIPRKRRTSLFSKSNFIFATPQTLNNDLRTKVYDLKDCVLMVLDECHKTGKRYAYNNIAREYMVQNPDPIILGLTASPGRNKEQILDLCDRLYIERITIRDHEDPDVKPYIHPIELDVYRCDMSPEIEQMEQYLRAILYFKLEQIQKKGFLKHKYLTYINKMDLIQLGRILWSILSRGPEDLACDENIQDTDYKRLKAKDQGYFFWLLNIQSQAMKLMHLIELITTQDFYPALRFINTMRKKVIIDGKTRSADKFLLKEFVVKKVDLMIRKCLENDVYHPKINTLVEILEQIFYKKDEAKVIIFTQYRDTVNRLLEIIEGLNDDAPSGKGRYKPVRFVGQSSKRLDPGLSQKDQKTCLDGFRKGNHNILIATRIAEEGLDIPSVNNIIFYEPVPSEIRYVQRKGRTGRHGAGNVSILSTNGTLDEVFLNVSMCRFKKMKEIVKSLKGMPLQQIHRFPMPPPNCDESEECKRALSERQSLVPELVQDVLDDVIGIDLEELATFYKHLDEYNVMQFYDVLELDDSEKFQTHDIHVINSREETDWHELLKKMRKTRPKEFKPRSIKRTWNKPSTEGGISLYNKIIKWIYEQIKNMGSEIPGEDLLEISLSELEEMAEFEEIEKEEFDYNLKSGVKKGYWELKDASDSGKLILMDINL
ncbi:MAG: DEAD/DEAH box helicase [Candidatus Hodarchaeota archaeon]